MTAAGRFQPVNGFVIIGKAQDFHGIGITATGRPFHNRRQGLLFLRTDFGARNFAAVDADIFQQAADNNKFFLRFEGNAACLLAITHRGIDNINHSHAIFSL